MSRSLPVPTSTWLPTTIGAVVEKYCSLKLGDLDVPALLAGPRVERDEIVVGRLEEQVVVPHAAPRLPMCVPPLVFQK